MLNDRRLFERMTDPEPPEARHRGINTRRLTESVIRYLGKMMNSRHGCTQIQPDFGIPDLNEFMYSFPESLGMMRSAIQQAIEKYEPRIKSVRVRFIENPDKQLKDIEIMPAHQFNGIRSGIQKAREAIHAEFEI